MCPQLVNWPIASEKAVRAIFIVLNLLIHSSWQLVQLLTLMQHPDGISRGSLSTDLVASRHLVGLCMDSNQELQICVQVLYKHVWNGH